MRLRHPLQCLGHRPTHRHLAAQGAEHGRTVPPHQQPVDRRKAPLHRVEQRGHKDRDRKQVEDEQDEDRRALDHRRPGQDRPSRCRRQRDAEVGGNLIDPRADGNQEQREHALVQQPLRVGQRGLRIAPVVQRDELDALALDAASRVDAVEVELGSLMERHSQ